MNVLVKSLEKLIKNTRLFNLLQFRKNTRLIGKDLSVKCRLLLTKELFLQALKRVRNFREENIIRINVF